MSNWNSTPTVSRHPRYTYQGSVRLMVPFAPWRLLLTLHGENLSASGIKACLPQKHHDARSRLYRDQIGKNAVPPKITSPDQQYEAAIAALIVEGDPYELQLEHTVEHLPAPVLAARLVRRNMGTGGLTLAFSFEEPNTDLLSLVHEIAADLAEHE